MALRYAAFWTRWRTGCRTKQRLPGDGLKFDGRIRTIRHNDVKAGGARHLYIEGNEMEAAMRVFILSVAAAAIIAGISYVSLNSFQESTATAYTTGSARLDWQEQSDVYGREVPPPKGAEKP
jgi:hypothetical protein